MTASDKLRELLASRPALPGTEELVRWWRSAELVREVIEALDLLKSVMQRLSDNNERDERALRGELAETRASTLQLIRNGLERDAKIDILEQEVRELEQQRDVARAELDATRTAISSECVEHVELNGHIDIAEQLRDYLNHEAMDGGDPSGKLHDFVTTLGVVVGQLYRQRSRANWYEAAYDAGKAKLIETAVSKALDTARAAARKYTALVCDLGAFADDSDPRVMATAGPIGAAQADLWIALGLDLDEEHARLQADIDSRCAVCGWPLAESVEEGCVRGNCSMRPRPGWLYAPERAKREADDLHERALRNGMPPSGRWA